MHKRFFALGLMLALTIVGAAWARQSTNRVAAHVDTVDVGTGGAGSVNGRVASVDVSGRTVTIDMAHTSTDFSSINAGDRVQLQLESAAAMASGVDNVGSPRRLLGLWLLAMTGITVVLRARRPRTI